MVREAQKIERLRFALPALPPVSHGRLGVRSEGLEHGHRRVHSIGAGHITAGCDHAPVTPADDTGHVPQYGPVAFLDSRVERVAVQVRDGQGMQLIVAHETA